MPKSCSVHSDAFLPPAPEQNSDFRLASNSHEHMSAGLPQLVRQKVHTSRHLPGMRRSGVPQFAGGATVNPRGPAPSMAFCTNPDALAFSTNSLI